MQLSNQALGAIMLALQESGEGLIIINPPTVRFTDNTEVTNQDLENMVADK